MRKKNIVIAFASSAIILLLSFTIVLASKEKVNTVNLACMQNAVEARDTAISNAFDTFSDSVKSALSTRKSALKSAWNNSDRTERKSAIKAAWSTYKSSIKSARENLRIAKKSAWSQFRISARSCKGTPDDVQTESVDNTL